MEIEVAVSGSSSSSGGGSGSGSSCIYESYSYVCICIPTTVTAATSRVLADRRTRIPAAQWSSSCRSAFPSPIAPTPPLRIVFLETLWGVVSLQREGRPNPMGKCSCS